MNTESQDINNLNIFADSGSFRDPSGRVFKFLENNSLRIIRGVTDQTFQEQAELIDSQLYASLVKEKKIVDTKPFKSTAMLDSETQKSWPYFLEHAPIDLITYPYEWTFGQLKDAAILHLEILKECLENGWIVKDSTPYNIQFVNNKPIFIDTPSITKWESGSGWDSYRQFCMMFLYPLMLESYLDIDFRVFLRSNLDGIDPKTTFNIIGFRKIYKRGVFFHVYLPHKIEKNILAKERDTAAAKKRTNISHSKLSVIALVDSMLGIIKSLKVKSKVSVWGDYDHINTYEHDDNIKKQGFIDSVTNNKKYNTVWDCGANTGLFSEHISGNAKKIIAMDGDILAVEKMYQRLKSNDSNITPMVINLENMSPDHGFNASERTRLELRSKPDLIMCLAIIHHIRISANIPCDNFLSYLRSLNSEIIIEFVQRDDEMVKKLLLNKKEQYQDYNLEAFEDSINNYFSIEKTDTLKGGHRKIYHLIPNS